MRCVHTALACLAALAAPGHTWGLEPSPLGDPLTLEAAVAYARQHNPEINAAEASWRAAQARPSPAGSLPDPLINTAYHNEGFDRLRQGSGEFSFLRFGIEQEVPFPGKLSRQEAAARSEADREGARYRATVLNVVTRVRLTYDDYFLADKSLAIVHGNLALLEQLADGAGARYRIGEGLQQDVARAQVELSILHGRLVSLEQERQSAEAMLDRLLNRPATAALGTPAPVEKRPLSWSLDQLETLAGERSPSLEAAEHDIARADAAFDLAKRQYYPDVVLRADYFNQASLTPEWEVGVGLRAPLYFWRKQSFGVQEAAAGAAQARASRQNTRQEVLARLRDLYAQATSAQRLLELYGTGVVPQAEVSLKSASAGYRVGKVDFLTLLNSFTVLYDYQLRYHQELTRFDKALAQIEEVAGLTGVAHE
ncbi:MAG: TolC family protein [Deltaproteobacteria bacterium]|nr:TolC family protein [Deltaproteobacteria bacterium]